VGPRAGLDRCGKSSPPPGFDPRTVQPVASHYTDCATQPTLTAEFCKRQQRNRIVRNVETLSNIASSLETFAI
jgi:hypothetical protein